ncbi:MAG: hypothetical protein IKZ53_06985 [Selenomonadaceae bacterium]|nr:hypothetical protein [Selenomonadaceae bacterium]
MIIVRKLIILAASAKFNNYCVAGVDVETGEWIRPISEKPELEEAVPIDDLKYPDNSRVELLDVAEIKFSDRAADNPIQPENFFYNDKYYWQKVGRMTLQEVIDLRGFDLRDKIFYNSERSIFGANVINFPERESLLLLPVENLFISIEDAGDHKKFFADFVYQGKNFHRFSVGDIAVRKKFADKSAGKHFFKDNAVVTFSLTNPYYKNAECYKMLAQIF